MKPRRIPATKAEKERYAKLKDIPCIACLEMGFGWFICGPTEIHHLTSGGRRLGNEFTIPLGPWHHRAVIPANAKTAREAEGMYGPSLETSKRKFTERYGGEKRLLAETNRLLEGAK